MAMNTSLKMIWQKLHITNNSCNDVNTILIFALSLFILVIGETALSFECANLLPVENDKIKYKKHGNRCEGFYISTVSSPAIEVVNITKGIFRFKKDRNEIIKLTCPEIDEKKVQLRAVGIPMKTYYRMDAEIDVGRILKWPVNDILIHTNMSSKKIGVYGWLKSKDGKIYYVPIQASSNTNTIANYSIWIFWRSSVDVVNVKWRYKNFVTTQVGRLMYLAIR